MAKTWQRSRVTPIFFKGLLAILFIVLVVGGRRAFIIWQEPKHLEQIARAHGYVGLIYGVPCANPDGTKLAYSQMDEGGIGVFLLDLKSGHKELVHEKVSTDDWFQNLDVWPWSPDGKYFIYTHTNLFVCNGTTGKVAEELPVEGVNGVASLAWLSPTSFVYVSKAGNLHQIADGGDQHWRELEGKNIKAGADDLTAISTDTICWRKGDYLWSLNLASDTAEVLFHARTNRLTDFSYARLSGKFLVNCAGKEGSTLRRMILDDGALEDYEAPSELPPAHSVHWLGEKKEGCAYICGNTDPTGRRSLELLPKEGATPIEPFSQGNIDAIAVSANGQCLFFVGDISNAPASSVWEYKSDSGEVRQVVPGLQYPSPYATRVNARKVTVITLDTGQRFNYYVCEPVGLNPHAHKKYPMVIGDTLYDTLDPAYENRVHGPYWAPMLANAGAYVVIVERPGGWMNEMDLWEDYVNRVYHKMLKNPAIDPHQVYLFATSAETQHLCNLVQENPHLWKGLILLNPGDLPDLDALARAKLPPKILIDQGALEGTNRANQYQLDGLAHGVRVECYYHDGQEHIPLGTTTLGGRAEAMMKFVFGD